MSFDRMHKASDELVRALGLHGKGKTGAPAERDARRYLVKTLREVRHQVALKAPVNVAATAKSVAEHLGEYDGDGNLKSAADLQAITAFVKTELDLFTAEAEKAKELGEHAKFHEDLGFIDGRAIKAEHLNDVGIVPSRPVS